ncbi:MAG TPA: alpha/beta hydrolase [Steroidobacteraceae bacterium]|nr:alpha/beta hydrolase [Steroidobacteraceae bacterium]
MSKTFDSDGIRIVYDDLGSGEPIVLLHGFAADRQLNWRVTGWYDLLVRAGYRVIAPDARGHGRSDKPSDPKAYVPAAIAGDTIRLLDHLGIERANLFGYSMGGRNAAWLLYRHPDRFLSAVIGGVGLNLLKVDDPSVWESRGFKLTADNEKTKSLAIPSLERLYGHATRRGGTVGALAACLLGAFPNLSAACLARIRAPTLVICGSKDTTAGSPIPLAEQIRGARAVVVPGATHLSSITDSFTKGAVLGFLGQRWEKPRRRPPRRKR